jgi:hypothetical protein
MSAETAFRRRITPADSMCDRNSPGEIALTSICTKAERLGAAVRGGPSPTSARCVNEDDPGVMTFISPAFHPWLQADLSRDSPDDSRSGVNIRVFPALPQDSREVRTANRASGSPNGGRGAALEAAMMGRRRGERASSDRIADS